MFLQGNKYKVTVEESWSDDGVPESATVTVEPTTEPITVSKPFPHWGYRSRYAYKFGGYPVFIQNPVSPCDDEGFPYTYICTIESGWGDSGNSNIFALIKDDKVLDVYLEASCC